jgi:hypothetical protein
MERRSDRVNAVSASCILVLARIQLGIEVPKADAIVLARTYRDIEKAVDVLGRGLHVHGTVGKNQTVVNLVIAEAKVGDSLTSEDAVVKMRKEAFETFRGRSRVVEEERNSRYHREAVTADIRNWHEDYGAFLDAIEDLFRSTKRHLELLNLSPYEMDSAIAELEDILSSAIAKASDGG